jgi:hypothetical protein
MNAQNHRGIQHIRSAPMGGFESEAAGVQVTLRTMQAALERLDWLCTSVAAGRLSKTVIEHVDAAAKAFAELVALGAD